MEEGVSSVYRRAFEKGMDVVPDPAQVIENAVTLSIRS